MRTNIAATTASEPRAIARSRSSSDARRLVRTSTAVTFGQRFFSSGIEHAARGPLAPAARVVDHRQESTRALCASRSGTWFAIVLQQRDRARADLARHRLVRPAADCVGHRVHVHRPRLGGGRAAPSPAGCAPPSGRAARAGSRPFHRLRGSRAERPPGRASGGRSPRRPSPPSRPPAPGAKSLVIAFIDIESVKMRPSNLSSSRSRPVRIGRLSVAGMPWVGSSAGRMMCVDMTASTPAAIAALNGRAPPRRGARAGARSRRGRGGCRSSVSPWPGKCLAVESMPPAWMPCMYAVAIAATRPGPRRTSGC